MTAPDARFRVLFVCTGNICRSPMAEHLLRHRLREWLGAAADAFRVESAGTGALVGEDMDPYAARSLAGLGVTAGSFTARDLVAEMVEQADLVLTATRQHRGAAVTLHPRATAKAFTLREFARLAGAVDPAELPPPADLVKRASALVQAAAARRGYVPVDHPSDDDIADPYHGPAEEFHRAAEQIAAAVDVIVARLADG